MELLIFAICLAASTIGGLCGIGGGVIIKPTLELLGVMSVSAISFLSGLSVMSMAAISVFRQRKSRRVELRIGSLLAVGAVVGGIVGNFLFQMVKNSAGDDSLVGMVQALVLALVTLLTLIFSTWLRDRLPSYHVTGAVPCVLLGCLMGVLSAFLGIGGGPINLAILYFAFSMDTKKAAANSLYIILFSQLSSLVTSFVKQTVPEFPWQYLLVMVAAGVLGGELGSRINKRISGETTKKLFAGLLVVVIMICLYNAWRYAG